MSTASEIKFDPRVLSIHQLRVNVKSLAAEAKIIRREERRCGRLYRVALSEHRRSHLRPAARIAHLALAFVRRRSYRSIEAEGSKALSEQEIKLLIEKVKRFTAYSRQVETDVVAWLRA